MTDIVAFVEARISERERAARAAQPPPWVGLFDPDDSAAFGTVVSRDGRTDRVVAEDVDRADGRHITLNDPQYVLDDMAAKRRILDLHSGDHECSTIRRGTDWDGKPYEEIDNCTWVLGGDCSTVRLLALPLAGHSDYREEWRP